MATNDLHGRLPRLAAVPAARSRAAVLKVRFFILLGFMVAMSLLGLVSAFAWFTQKPPVIDLRADDPQGRGLAEVVAEGYVSGFTIPVPTAAGVVFKPSTPVETQGEISWEGFSTFTLGGSRTELHRFLFVRKTGTDPLKPVLELMRLSVLVAVPAGGNPVLAAQPQFAPASWASSDVVTDYSDLESVALPPSAQDQIQAWATAWAAGDSETLRLLTGDATPGVRYVGLGGYQVKSARVVSALLAGQDAFLVRARIVLSGANESILEMDMDLTVKSASTGLPNVVGWGPAGSGILSPADVRVDEE